MGNNLWYVELRKVEDMEIDLQVEHFLAWHGLEKEVGAVLNVAWGGFS
jgi:hypothetical protein